MGASPYLASLEVHALHKGDRSTESGGIEVKDFTASSATVARLYKTQKPLLVKTPRVLRVVRNGARRNHAHSRAPSSAGAHAHREIVGASDLVGIFSRLHDVQLRFALRDARRTVCRTRAHLFQDFVSPCAYGTHRSIWIDQVHNFVPIRIRVCLLYQVVAHSAVECSNFVTAVLLKPHHREVSPLNLSSAPCVAHVSLR